MPSVLPIGTSRRNREAPGLLTVVGEGTPVTLCIIVYNHFHPLAMPAKIPDIHPH